MQSITPFARTAVQTDFARVILAIAGCVGAVLMPQGAQRLSIPLFLSSALLLGVPHGAADVLIPLRLWNGNGAGLRITCFFALYLAVFALGGATWFFAPRVFFGAFLAFTAVHWGTGDFADLRPWLRCWLACGVSRGILVVGGILHAGPVETGNLWNYFVGTSGSYHWPQVGLWIMGFGITMQVVSALVLRRQSGIRIRTVVLESVSIALVFLVCPVFLAIAVYFLGFHASRHLGRIERWFRVRSGTVAWCGFHGILILISLACVLACWWCLPGAKSIASQQNAVCKYLAMLALFTVPHALLVLWIDVRDVFGDVSINHGGAETPIDAPPACDRLEV